MKCLMPEDSGLLTANSVDNMNFVGVISTLLQA